MAITPSSSQPVGTIKVVIGDVKIVGVDGVARVAHVGDKVFAREVLITAANAAVQIQLENGNLLDMGRSSQLALDGEILAAPPPQTAAQAEQDVTGLQPTVTSGDCPPPAGGSEACQASDPASRAILVIQQADPGASIGRLPSVDLLDVSPKMMTSHAAALGDTGDEPAQDPLSDLAPITPPAASTGATGPVSVAGLALDGYIAGATVFADANTNGQLDTGEASTTTDNAGNFELFGSPGPLVLTGGTDIATGFPFAGVLRAPQGYTVISPLSTLVATLAESANMTAAQAEQNVLAAFGIDPAVILGNLDPITTTLSADPAVAAVGSAVFLAGTQVINTVVMAGSLIAGAEGSAFASAGARVFEALAQQILANPGTALDLTSSSTVATIINNAAPALSDTLTADAALVVAASNTLLQQVAQQAPDGASLLAGVTEVTIVAQGAAADSLQQAGAMGSAADTVNAFTGDALQNAVNDASGQTGDLDGPAVQNAPVAANDVLVTSEDTAVTFPATTILGNDRDNDGDALSVVLTSGPSHGALVANADGTFIYTPAANFNGVDSFTYRATDGVLSSDPKTVSITVSSVNDAPVAVNNVLAASEDTPVAYTAVELLGNDADVDGNALTIASVTSGAGGTAVLNGNGTVTFAPTANFNGAASFNYTASDGAAASNSATVTVNVAAVNDAPVANTDALSATEDTPVTYTAAQLLGNDTDADGNALTIASVTSGTGGTAVLNSNGTVTFTPTGNFNGAATFSYTASDGALTSNSAAVTVNVTAVNDAPVAVNDTLGATEDTPVTYTAAQLLGNDTDVDGNALTIASVTSGAGGTAVLNGNGTVTFTPTANFNGAASFTYTASDGTATSNSAMVTVNVAAVNDAPTLTTLAGVADTVNEDTHVEITFAEIAAQGNEADVDGTVAAFVVKAVSSGTLLIGTDIEMASAFAAGTNDTIDATKQAYWTGAGNANGTLNAFTVVAKDDGGLESAAPVQAQVSVATVNDAPTLTEMAGVVDTVPEETHVEITFAEIAAQGNEGDVDGTVTAFMVKAVSSGTLLIGTDIEMASAFAAGTNDTIDATKQAYWMGEVSAHGTVNAFTVVAKDDSGLESATPVQVQVEVEVGSAMALKDEQALTTLAAAVDTAPGTTTVAGTNGNDILVGGAGDEIFIGGKGDDTLTGGDGTDVFKFGSMRDGTDTLDFVTGNLDPNKGALDPNADVLDLHDVLIGNVGLADAVAADDAATVSQYLNFTVSGTTATLQVDADGNGGAAPAAMATFAVAPSATATALLETLLKNNQVVV